MVAAIRGAVVRWLCTAPVEEFWSSACSTMHDAARSHPGRFLFSSKRARLLRQRVCGSDGQYGVGVISGGGQHVFVPLLLPQHRGAGGFIGGHICQYAGHQIGQINTPCRGNTPQQRGCRVRVGGMP